VRKKRETESISLLCFLVNKALASLESDLAALYLLVDVVCNIDERFLDVLRSLGRGLKEEETVLLSKLLTFLRLYHTAVFKISLVTDQHDCGVLAGIFAAVLQPCSQVVKGLAPSDIVHEQCAGSVAVIAPCDGAELLLASSIPNLKLHLLTANGDCAAAKFHTNGQVVDRLEPLVCELKKQATLTHSSITDDDVLEKILVLKVDLRDLRRVRRG